MQQATEHHSDTENMLLKRQIYHVLIDYRILKLLTGNHHNRLAAIHCYNVGCLVWLGAVLLVCPCVTYEFKSVSFHLIEKNQTQNLT